MSVNNLNSLLTIPINSTIQDANEMIIDSKMTNNSTSNKNIHDEFFESDSSSLKSIKKYFQLEIESNKNNDMLLGSIENIDLAGLDSYDENFDQDDDLDVNNKDFTRVTKYSHLMKSKIRRDYDLNDDEQNDTFISDQQNDSLFLDEMTYKKYSYLNSENKSMTNLELKKIYKELNEIHNKLMVNNDIRFI